MSTPSSAPAAPSGLGSFAKYAWGFIAYNFLVIVWGAYVRASGSGAGCGAHWPTCNGDVIPRPKTVATMIEVSHRLTSGLALIGTVVLVVWAFRAFPAGHRVRRASLYSLGFMLAEALVGAALVLFEHVAQNPSQKRALSMSLHLTNTFFLLASLVLTAYFASGGAPAKLRGQGFLRIPIGLAMVGALFVGTSGAVAALGDTLFPAKSLGEGIAQDLSASAHIFLRLRVLHPILACTLGVVVVGTSTLARSLRPGDRAVSFCSRVLTGLFVAQLLVGLLNVGLLAPIPVQLVHLVLADSVWVFLVLLAVTSFAHRPGIVVTPAEPLGEPRALTHEA